MVIHCYCERLVRCTDGSNHQHLIVVIICERAREAGTQYTKRMLPWFVIPECNIRLDLVLELRKKHPTAGSARAHGYAVIGSACERTIARHLLWVDDTIAAMLLEVNEWVAELAPFTALPPVRVGEDALAQLRRLSGRAGEGQTGRARYHRSVHRYRLRSPRLRRGARPEPPADFIEFSISRRLLVRYHLSIHPQEASKWINYWFPPTVWRSWKSCCCSFIGS